MLAALLLSAVLGADEFVIEEFSFAWTVDKIGDNQLMVLKDDNRTAIRIWDFKESVTVSPGDGVAVGKALKRMDEAWKRLMNKPLDEKEEIEVSDKIGIVFFKSKAGFFASIEIGDQLVLLDRKAANRFAPHLLKSVEMAKFVDERIKP